MRWVAGAFAVFILVLVWAFIMESEPLPTNEVVRTKDNEKRVLGSLKWKSAPRWNIPVKTQDHIPKKALADAIMDDDVCAFLMNEDVNDYEKLVQAFLTATSKSEEAEFIRVLSSSDNSQSLGGRFYYALRAGNLTYGPSRTPNYKEALEELKRLENLDPENGAYAFYAGPLLLELNYPPEAQIKAFQRAFSKPRFDTFLVDIMQALEKSGRASTTHFLASQILLANMPAPAVGSVQAQVYRFLDKDDEAFNKLALKFTERILKNVQAGAGHLEENSYPIVEYQVMKGLYLKSFRKLYPGTVNVPNYKDLMREPASIGRTIDDIVTVLEPMQRSLACERERVDEVFYTWKR